MIYESNALKHYGIPKMRWGERRFQNPDGSYTPEGRERYRKSGSKGKTGGLRTGGVYDRKDGTKDVDRLKKDAKKDAEDMARAKAYYGEGAGNRRKQIRNRISERMKDPDYKAEYEKQLASQDMSKHQKAANRERKVQDTKDAAARVGRGLKNILLGLGTTSLTALALYNGAKMIGADKKIAEFGKKAVSDVIKKAKSLKKPSVKDYNWHSSNHDYTVPESSYTVPKSEYTVPESSYRTSSSSTKNSKSNSTRRDIKERTDRAKHGRTQPYIDKDGNIHWY